MKTRIHRYLPLLLIALLPGLLCSCTAIGASFGYMIDKRNARVIHARYMNADSIPTGRTVVVKCTNGDVVTGTFVGVHPLTSKAYAANYSLARSALDSSVKLPALNDTLSIVRPSGKHMDWVFTGFGPQALAVNAGSPAASQYFPLISVSKLQARSGQPYDAKLLRTLMNAQRLPLDAEIIVESSVPAQIPLNNVKDITALASNTHWWLAGAGAGFIVDAVIVGAFITSSMSDWMHNWDRSYAGTR